MTSVGVFDPAGHVTTTYLDVRGQPMSIVDPNGKTTTTAYDPLSRLTNVWLPGRTTAQAPNAEYVYTVSDTVANHVETKRLGPNGNQIRFFEIYDGRMRPRQSQKTAPDGMRAITDMRYDSRGLTVRKSEFYNGASAPIGTLVTFADAVVATQTRYEYDAVGRQVEEALWSLNVKQWDITRSYDGDRVNVGPPAGAPRQQQSAMLPAAPSHCGSTTAGYPPVPMRRPPTATIASTSSSRSGTPPATRGPTRMTGAAI
ncbi:RHS repeat domain-containing protein [Phytohabitans suffuscus]|uniref:RHS repeat domain-containing protein n=1 Tax=Phytohabitans suffuscus TaxID=624315 RepID=UPI001E407408|nr:RHS repeat domain-containing protein [Phytohabitans suffuscus]